MRIEFRFNNTAQLVLTPENSKERALLGLMLEGVSSLKVIPSPKDSDARIFEIPLPALPEAKSIPGFDLNRPELNRPDTAPRKLGEG